ncbi:MAG: hypothetical protein H7222_09275 [Methylotenera sp.]|nr:hypothetical protein [Oligoflexia bacterium]
MSFKGHIEAGETDRFKAVYQEGDTTLTVDSPGGDAEVGVRLGMKLFPEKLYLIVDGFCASSCANYAFTSGATKFIKKGWVGYHGNLSAFLGKDRDKSVVTLQTQHHLSEKEIKAFFRGPSLLIKEWGTVKPTHFRYLL